MNENFICNKYFVTILIIIIIILIVLLIVFLTKKNSRIERMENIDKLTFAEKPWSNTQDADTYKIVDNDFDKYVDELTKLLGNKNRAKRKDEVYKDYIQSKPINKNIQQTKNTPTPLDDRPDLSQCQPCICPNDRYIPDSESSENDNHLDREIRKKISELGSYVKNKYKR
ncbi:hypothetical protein [Acanthamoeba polyphaga mimivirus]|nr:hypothetical protein [Acanthamoeba castellanii mamavirus]AHA45560.1 hypothetical protein HIRU_S654 [Hirudovirus strain Sangsue]QTF49216.1 hypothetical protein [Mimivirus reunion]UMZ08177.1 hypothetical protein [Acanthamoeba polyphaga mimivirus]WMV61659.1 hypothetical protein qu_324 [Mimivirus sp.]